MKLAKTLRCVRNCSCGERMASQPPMAMLARTSSSLAASRTIRSGARVKKGAEDAGKLLPKSQGGSVTWLGPQNYDNLGPDAAELIRQAIDQGADRHRRP